MYDPSTARAGEYAIAYGQRETPAPATVAVKVERVAAGLEVNTGALRFFISNSRFGFIENVRTADGREVQREPMSAEIVEAGGQVWRALDLPVSKMEVEQAGPLHAVILVETR